MCAPVGVVCRRYCFCYVDKEVAKMVALGLEKKNGKREIFSKSSSPCHRNKVELGKALNPHTNGLRSA